MAAEDLLRLAWQAHRDGRQVLRDALMTLAVVECGPAEAVIASRCRRWLIAKRPSHWLKAFSTLGQAVNHPHVSRALGRLRATFPTPRVRQLLLKENVRRGPYTGADVPLSQVVDDMLTASYAPVRPSRPSPAGSVRGDQLASLPRPKAKKAMAKDTEAA